MNEQVQTVFENFLNSNVGTIVVGVLGVLLIFLVIFSKTSLGKKLFTKAQYDIKQINEIACLSNEKVEQVKLLAEDKINALTSEYERKSAIIVSYYEFLENGIYQIIEKVPNEKVKKELKDFKAKFDEKKLEIASEFPTYDEFVELTRKAREISEQVNEIEKAYQEKLVELQEKYENRFKELEDKLNEREEETHTDTEI